MEISIEILKEDFSTLQELIDYISVKMKDLIGQSKGAGFYSTDFDDDEIFHLICASGDNCPKIMELDDDKYFAIDLTTPFNGPGVLVFATNVEEKHLFSADLVKIIELKASLIIYRKRQIARNYLAEVAIEKSDANSFAHKILPGIKDSIVFSDAISVFISHREHHRVKLAATTRVLAKKKAAYVYHRDSANAIAKCCLDGIPISNYGKHHIKKFKNFEPVFTDYGLPGKPSVIWPIKFNAADDEYNEKDSPPLGVLEIIGIHRRQGKKRWDTFVTVYDALMLKFLSEIMYIVMSQSIKIEKKQKNYRVFSHGILSSLDFASKQIGILENSLFVPDSSKIEHHDGQDVVEALFSIKSDVLNVRQLRANDTAAKYNDFLPNLDVYATNSGRIYDDIVDTHSALEDIRFHFIKVLGLRQKPTITNVRMFTEVLKPLQRISNNMATYRGRPQPWFSNLNSKSLINIPIVNSDAKILMSIFRNLVENSIKYSPGYAARIDIKYEVESDFLLVHFKDHGIGIPDRDINIVFQEGYRGLRAEQLDNEGVGWGLGFCRDAAELLGGEVYCQPRENGAHFVVKVPLHQGTNRL